MGGRSGQSIERGSTRRAGGVTGAPYSGATITIRSGYELTSLSSKDAMQMAGIPPDVKGKINLYQDGNTIFVDYSNEGLLMSRKIFIDRKQVSNEEFKIENDSRFKGRGLEIFESQVNKLRKQGYNTIFVQAAGRKNSRFNGYYTWAVFGYIPDNQRRNLQLLNSRAGTNYTNWLDVVRTRSGAALWKEHGEDWFGEFDLSDNSESMKTLGGYIKYKRSQRNS